MTEPATPLQRQLTGQMPARPTPLDALRCGRRMFLRGERIEMGPLAEEVGVNRATLYRWVGGREQFLTEVIWSLLSDTIDTEREVVDDNGGERVARILTAVVHHVRGNEGMQAFLDREGELAMRLLTMGPSFQPRLVGTIRELLEAEVSAGRIEVPVPLEELAFELVRLVESHVHRRFITGKDADAASAGRLFRMLLCPLQP
jgi:AcrR family transcriptional regulator